MPTFSEAKQQIDRSLSIIAADCADPQSRVGCDQLTVGEVNRLMQAVRDLAAMRKFTAKPI